MPKPIPKFDTTALPKLQKWAKARDFGPSKLADLLGAEQSQASRWLRGESRPDSPMRIRIEAETGGEVAQADWLTKDERKALAEHERHSRAQKRTGTDGG